ncbi:MAG: antitoxin family protein [Phycisphaerales bacterium]|nr:antitoxin family protein [Phycisphaerales bacterium]
MFTMRTIRAIFSAGQLKPLEPLDLPENTRLTLALFEGDDLPLEGLAAAAHAGGAFAFLDDPREDIYSQTDGEGV